MRAVVGVLGILIPIVLVVGDIVFLEARMTARGSLSAYYHSGMRDVFVAGLAVVGVFLITYKIFERNLDNTLSLVAGVTALGVAFFPTGIPDDIDSPLTPLQERLGEDLVETAHYVSAAVFIISLAVISYWFAQRESKRDRLRDGRSSRRSPEFWRRFHLLMSGLIVGSILFIVGTQFFDVLDDNSLLLGESLAVLAFGASWLAKGLDLDFLLDRSPVPTPTIEPPSAL